MRAEMLSWLNFSKQKLWSDIVDGLDVLLSRYVRALLLLARRRGPGIHPLRRTAGAAAQTD